jgi:hypothetical protein
VIVAHVGVRVTGDGESLGLPLGQRVSGAAGIGVLVPVAPAVTLAFEANYDGKRFDETEDDARVLVGADWTTFGRGVFRGALASGLTNGSPDYDVRVGYALRF